MLSREGLSKGGGGGGGGQLMTRGMLHIISVCSCVKFFLLPKCCTYIHKHVMQLLYIFSLASFLCNWLIAVAP